MNEWHEKGQLSGDGGRYAESLAFFRKAMEAEPDEGLHASEAAVMLLYLRRRKEAMEYSLNALRLSPHNPHVNANHAVVLAHLDLRQNAIQVFERLISQSPEMEFLHFRFGQTLVLLGDLKRAEEEFREAIKLNPSRGHNYYQLSRLTKLQADDPAFVMLQEQIQHTNEYTSGRGANFHYAYAHALKSQGRDEEAFDHFVQANAKYRPGIEYQEDHMVRLISSNVRMIDKQGMQRWEGFGVASEAPLFIISLPRSGSTLVEQILSSHPQVGGIEERGAMEQAMERTGGFSLYHHEPGFTQGKLQELGEAYLDIVYTSEPEMRKYKRFTDKSLSLFQYVGWAHLAFPKAKFVYVTRDYIDIMYSIFSLRFAGIDYAYDLGEIGRRIRLFHETMEYWKSMLPQGIMHEVKYEYLVNDLQGETKRMLDFCELTFEQDCLQFHKNDRLVNTASNMQVRKPLYRTSLKHARPTDEQLKPFYDGLGAQLTALVKEQETMKG